MAKTTDVGRVFLHIIRVNPGTKFFHRGKSVEVEHPYRTGKPLIMRLPFRRALVIGVWQDTGWDETTALYEAVSGWGVDPYSTELDEIAAETRAMIRDNIAASGLDLDEEWKVISMLGAEE